MISVSALGRSYGAQTLFHDASIQFNPGELYGVVGANGSGKSTFLRILAGDEEPSEGTVSLPRRASLGVLKQDHFAYDDVPILDVVMMGSETLWAATARPRPTTRAALRAAAAAAPVAWCGSRPTRSA